MFKLSYKLHFISDKSVRFAYRKNPDCRELVIAQKSKVKDDMHNFSFISEQFIHTVYKYITFLAFAYRKKPDCRELVIAQKLFAKDIPQVKYDMHNLSLISGQFIHTVQKYTIFLAFAN